ncbi:MAG: Holliday junction resolvase RuvX [Planctomycetota bacterium]|jgi:putative Holliday junction resolvase|nr:Holliday junction resolvase RuvX [Planctomycetota bacterium]
MIHLGVDLGERRVGFAVSDAEERLAVPSGFARSTSSDQTLSEVIDKAGREGAEMIVVGYPLNMDGRAGPKAQEALAFRDHLLAAGWQAVLWDERLTTSEAERVMREAGVRRRQRKQHIDANSAQRILSSYLDCRRISQAAPTPS